MPYINTPTGSQEGRLERVSRRKAKGGDEHEGEDATDSVQRRASRRTASQPPPKDTAWRRGNALLLPKSSPSPGHGKTGQPEGAERAGADGDGTRPPAGAAQQKQPQQPRPYPQQRIMEMEIDLSDLEPADSDHCRISMQEDEAASGLLKLAMKSKSMSDSTLLAPQSEFATNAPYSSTQQQRRSGPRPDGRVSSYAASSPTRRQAHIVSEQKRRQTINEGFEELRYLVPTCHNYNDSKAAILKKTINYVRYLQERLSSLSTCVFTPNSSSSTLASLQTVAADLPDQVPVKKMRPRAGDDGTPSADMRVDEDSKAISKLSSPATPPDGSAKNPPREEIK